MRKNKWLIAVMVVSISLAFGSAIALADLSFEQGLDDWNVEEKADDSPDTVHEYIYEVMDRASDGVQSVRLGATVYGDESVEENTDWTQTIIWKGPYDLTQIKAIWIDMTDILRTEPELDSGWGMEAALIVSDGTNESRALLWNYHDETTGFYGPEGLEDNLYESLLTGDDGTQWYRYRVPLDDLTRWGATDMGGGPIENVDPSITMIGIGFASYSWNLAPQTLSCEGLVDNITFEYEALPVSIKITPRTLNLRSKGRWITVHADIAYSDVDLTSLALNGVPVSRTVEDDNGNLVAKFLRSEIKAIVSPPRATLTLTGLLFSDGSSIMPFEGSDTIRVIKRGRK